MECLYRHFNSAGDLLYVGISMRVFHRLIEHVSASHWSGSITRVTIERFESRDAAARAERLAIQNENPLHNERGRKFKPAIIEEHDARPTSEIRGKRSLTVEDFSALYSVGRTAIYQMLQSGEIASYKVGRSRRISADAAEAWLQSQQAAA